MVESLTSALAVESLYSIVSYPEVLSDSKLTRPTGRSPLVISRVAKDQRSLSSSSGKQSDWKSGLYLEAPVPPAALPGQPSLSNFEASFGAPTGGELERVPLAPQLMEGSATSGSTADKGKQRAA